MICKETYTPKPGLTAHCCQDGVPVSHSNQLLNHIIDCHATRRPQALWAEYPKSATSYDQGFMKITYRKLANAINVVAWWLFDNLGHGQDFETLAYIGLNDLTYPALMLGAVKAGYKILLLSSRNSIEAQLHLLRVTKCKTFLTPELFTPSLAALINALDDSFKIMKVPSVDDLLQPRCKHFTYDVPFKDGASAPFVTMHTSGSTGLPKPITWPQSFVSAYAKQLQLLPPNGFESTDQLYEANRIFVVFPPFHAAYMIHTIVNAITNQTTVIFPIKGAIPSALSLVETVKHTKVDLAFTVPLIIEELSRSPELLESVASHVDILAYSGGDVPRGCGDIVAARIPLINFYGCTEGATPALIHLEEGSREDWKYLSFHPKAGADFRHHADDMYELYIVRHPDLEAHQQIFQTFPHIQEFATRDLFRRHPNNPHLWSHCGRADDTIVFLNGEKVAPVETEQYIFAQNPEINGILIGGAQRFQPMLLIELVSKQEVLDTNRTRLIEKFWPSIERANEFLPKHAQISKSHILFALPERPISRSPKGTIQRAATFIEYAQDIDALYEQTNQKTEVTGSNVLCDLHDTIKFVQYLESTIERLTGLVLEPESNLFMQGIDSLQTLLLVRTIQNEVSSLPPFSVSEIYSHPTIKSLVTALQMTAREASSSMLTERHTKANDISSILAEYVHLVDQVRHRSASPVIEQGRPVYLLTGSTGSLGSHILQGLLDSDIAHVYCLNRSSDSQVLQQQRNSKQGLSTDFPASKVTFLTVDLSLSSFGLDLGTYRLLSESITHIIHNAWPVDFNIPLSSFIPQIKGVVNLIRFCSIAAQNPSLLYVSSVSATSRLSTKSVPEAIIEDSSAAANTGYGASKLITEQLLDHAAHRLGLENVQIARVGQIAGPRLRSGQWNSTEWFPSLIRSSVEIGMLPTSLGLELDQIDWIPVDDVSSIILEMAQQRLKDQTTIPSNGAKVLNVVNPRTTSWSDLLPAITQSLAMPQALSSTAPITDHPVSDSISISDSDSYSHPQSRSQSPIKLVPIEIWLSQIQAHFKVQESLLHRRQKSPELISLASILASNPAVKLLDFYRDAAYNNNNNNDHHHNQHHHDDDDDEAKTWNTELAQNSSPTLRGLCCIQGDWIRKWIADWI